MQWEHGRISHVLVSHVFFLFSKAKQYNTIGKDTTAWAPMQYKVSALSTQSAAVLVNIECAQRFGLLLLLLLPLLGLGKQPRRLHCPGNMQYSSEKQSLA